MDLFHNTATSLELPVVVFHDALTPAFVRQHNTSLLRFVQVPGAGATSAYSQNDLRFEVFLDWLQVKTLPAALSGLRHVWSLEGILLRQLQPFV